MIHDGFLFFFAFICNKQHQVQIVTAIFVIEKQCDNVIFSCPTTARLKKKTNKLTDKVKWQAFLNSLYGEFLPTAEGKAGSNVTSSKMPSGPANVC